MCTDVPSRTHSLFAQTPLACRNIKERREEEGLVFQPYRTLEGRPQCISRVGAKKELEGRGGAI